MMGVISSSIVVTQADRKGRHKRVQPGNKEQAIAIACINTESHDILPFLLVKGIYYLANWYTEGALLHNQVIKSIENSQTDNTTGLEQIQHFEKHTIQLKKGVY